MAGKKSRGVGLARSKYEIIRIWVTATAVVVFIVAAVHRLLDRLLFIVCCFVDCSFFTVILLSSSSSWPSSWSSSLVIVGLPLGDIYSIGCYFVKL
jgi:hypothetical protein